MFGLGLANDRLDKKYCFLLVSDYLQTENAENAENRPSTKMELKRIIDD